MRYYFNYYFNFTIIDPVTVNQTSCDPIDVGIDTITTITSLGCDSITFVHTTLITGETIFSNVTTCDPAQVGSDTTFLPGPACDTTLITISTLLIVDPVTVNQTSCDPTDVGIDTITTITSLGCDSITFVITDLIPQTIQLASTFTCDPIQVGIDSSYIPGPACDTLRITTIHLAPTSTEQISLTTCILSEVGSDTLVLANQYGCDSTIITTNTFDGILPILLTEPTCKLSNVGIDTTILVTSDGCDSTIITNYIFDAMDTLSITIYTCDSLADGITLDTISGLCDTIALINTIWVDCTPTEIFLTACDADSFGVYMDTLTSQYNLDSIIITTISQTPTDTIFSSSTTCDPDLAGIITTITSNLYGCEEINVEEVSLLPRDTTMLISTSCDPTQWIDTSYIMSNQFGCDSLITRIVNPTAPSITMLQAFSCDSTEIGIDTIQFLNTFEGCDSFIVQNTQIRNLEFEYIIEGIKCFGETGVLFIDPIEGTAPFQYSFDESEFQSEALFTDILAGDHLIEIKDNIGCRGFINMNIPFLIEHEVSLGDDQEVYLGESVEVEAMTTVTAIDTIIWEENINIDCSDCMIQEFTPFNSTILNITVIDDDGCIIKDRVNISVRKDKGLYIPNAFSPNGDGDNETFIVFADPSVASVDKMIITDRWGEVVYSKSNVEPGNASQGWDGRLNGKLFNPGVFIYMIEVTYIDGRKEQLSGDLTLFR